MSQPFHPSAAREQAGHWSPGATRTTAYQNVQPLDVPVNLLVPAYRRLAALPPHVVPEPFPARPDSPIPYPLNPFFTGRADECRVLARALKSGSAAASRQAVILMGASGVGKSHLAAEFAHRYGQFFAGGVFWLNFSDPTTVPGQVVACGQREQLELRLDFHTLPLHEQVPLVLGAWQSSLPRLLIFDNCEDEESLAFWRPPTGGSCVLVTSRRQRWNVLTGLYPYLLERLPLVGSLALLNRYGDGSEEASGALDEIVREVERLPLALHLAGCALRAASSPDAYLKALRSPDLPPHLLAPTEAAPSTPAQLILHAFAANHAALDPQQPTDSLARRLLARASYFGEAEPIPTALLAATLAPEPAGEEEIEAALARLAGLGLVTQQGGSGILVHPLIAHCVQGMASDGEAMAAVECALLALATRLNQANDPAAILAWHHHLRTVTARALARGDERAAALSAALGDYLHRVGDHAAAHEFLSQALTIYEQTGLQATNLVRTLAALGRLSHAQGDESAAKAQLERALLLAEEPDAVEMGAIAVTLSTLAEVLAAQGAFKEAQACLGQVAAMQEAQGPEARLSLSSTLQQMGLLLQQQGTYGAARPYLEQALGIRRAMLGIAHPDTALSLGRLGMLCEAQGDYECARGYYERALGIQRQVLGGQHPDTAFTLNSLALLLQGRGLYDGARQHFEEALAIYEQSLGNRHPDTAICLNNLAVLLHTQGDYEAADRYAERALLACEQIFGAMHPRTADSLHTLGQLRHLQGAYDEARLCLERARAIYEQCFGPHHLHTAHTLNSLGMLRHVQGAHEEAQAAYEQALAIYEQAAGNRHPLTAICLNNLAALLRTRGHYTRARRYAERALTICEQSVGEMHPHTANSLNTLGMLLAMRGDYARARRYYQRALTIYDELLGSHHPHAQVVRRHLSTLEDRAAAGRAARSG